MSGWNAFRQPGAIVFEYAARRTAHETPRALLGDADPIRRLPPPWGGDGAHRKSIKGFWRQAGATTWQKLSGTPSLAGRVKTGVTVLNRSQPPAGDPARKPLTATFAYVDVAC